LIHNIFPVVFFRIALIFSLSFFLQELDTAIVYATPSTLVEAKTTGNPVMQGELHGKGGLNASLQGTITNGSNVVKNSHANSITIIVTVLGILTPLGIYFWSRKKRISDKKSETKAQIEENKRLAKQQEDDDARTHDEWYRKTLVNERDKCGIPSSSAFSSFMVKLSDTFVSLSLSVGRYNPQTESNCFVSESSLTPEMVMIQSFERHRLLLVIGDPGSGKTTLLSYYALSLLKNQRYKDFGFNKPLKVFFFSLRDLTKTKEGKYEGLAMQLSKWSQGKLSPELFSEWLEKEESLVLMDGLDEISNVQERIDACRWIDRVVDATKAYVVVSSRTTGYRKGDGIELRSLLSKAVIENFTRDMQNEFIRRWFNASYLGEFRSPDKPEKEWKRTQIKAAEAKAKAIIAFLDETRYMQLRELAGIPLLLQIMAALWKERDTLPSSRVELYEIALNYLLDYRDRQKDLRPLLPAIEAKKVLAPVALWMQENLQKDEAECKEIQQKMQGTLKELSNSPEADVFFENIVDRAGLLVAYGSYEYRFSHKTFREYLAGVQLKEDRPYEQLDRLVYHFGSDRFDWWYETLRFFIWQVDARVFDTFMKKLFNSPVSEKLSQKQQDLLQLLVEEAQWKKIDALKAALYDPKPNQQRYVLMCLKAIGSAEALAVVSQFETQHAKATDFRNLLEQNAHYILIKGGTFTYSVTGKPETVPDLYVAKYPVTNALYRQFISYLQTGKAPVDNPLSIEMFRNALRALSITVTGIRSGKDFARLFQSSYDVDKQFNKEDQPVVGVSWGDARTYCLWLSLMESGGKDTGLYRLPTEIEWEYAAAGKEGRTYPWGKGVPTPQRANYDNNEGATTKVGRYPDGATPEGLYDMAGNVWELTDSLYDNNTAIRSLRGGSWLISSDNLRCSARNFNYTVYRLSYIGFRVVRSSHSLSF